MGAPTCTICFALQLDCTLFLQISYATGCVCTWDVYLQFIKAFRACLCPKHADKYSKLQPSQW